MNQRGRGQGVGCGRGGRPARAAATTTVREAAPRRAARWRRAWGSWGPRGGGSRRAGAPGALRAPRCRLRAAGPPRGSGAGLPARPVLVGGAPRGPGGARRVSWHPRIPKRRPPASGGPRRGGVAPGAPDKWGFCGLCAPIHACKLAPLCSLGLGARGGRCMAKARKRACHPLASGASSAPATTPIGCINALRKQLIPRPARQTIQSPVAVPTPPPVSTPPRGGAQGLGEGAPRRSRRGAPRGPRRGRRARGGARRGAAAARAARAQPPPPPPPTPPAPQPPPHRRQQQPWPPPPRRRCRPRRRRPRSRPRSARCPTSPRRASCSRMCRRCCSTRWPSSTPSTFWWSATVAWLFSASRVGGREFGGGGGGGEEEVGRRARRPHAGQAGAAARRGSGQAPTGALTPPCTRPHPPRQASRRAALCLARPWRSRSRCRL
jgi:hypothetical protein